MKARLTLRLVNSITGNPDRDTLVWDRELLGFGLRVSRGGVKSYVVQYRAPDGRDRRMTLGKHGVALTLEQARKLAAKRLLEARNDHDPTEERRVLAAAPTVEDLVRRFLDEHVAKRSPSMQRNCRALCRLYLLPALATRKVADVRWEDLEKIHLGLHDRPYQANRFLATCSKAWALAARWGWWPREMPNPAQGHDRHHEERRGQALDMAGLARLGEALRQERPGSIPAAALTFILLTGCRPGEALAVRWAALDLDARLWHLPASKAGPRTVYLGRPAIDLLGGLPRCGELVFPGRGPGPMSDLKRLWERLSARAQLPARMRLYDATRHTFNSTAAYFGVPREIRMRLMGHSLGRDVHDIYTHLQPERLLAAADLIAGGLAAALRGERQERHLLHFEPRVRL
jgi:integrase